MVDFIDVPLVSEWLSFSEGKQKTSTLFSDFIQQNLTVENVDVPGTTATVIYSGQIGGQETYIVAQNMAQRSITAEAPDGQLRIINNTKIGKFLLYVTDRSDIYNYFLNGLGR